MAEEEEDLASPITFRKPSKPGGRKNEKGGLDSPAAYSLGVSDTSRQIASPSEEEIITARMHDRLDISTENPTDQFEVIELLGEGSYGSVYKCLRKDTQQVVAVKVIPFHKEFNNVKSEIEILKDINSEWVTAYYGSYIHDDDIWIVMEYCAMGSVGDLCTICSHRLSEAEVATIMHGMLQGLVYLNNEKKIHRDIKAGNVLLDEAGKVKLADFGVSAELKSHTSKRQSVIGTPYWMAPEVISKDTTYDHKCDIWSLGITCIELADGQPPLSKVHPMRAIFIIPNSPPPTFRSPSDWSATFNDFVSKCLVLDHNTRPSAQDLLSHAFIQAHEPQRLRELVVLHLDAIGQFRANQTNPDSTAAAAAGTGDSSDYDDDTVVYNDDTVVYNDDTVVYNDDTMVFIPSTDNNNNNNNNNHNNDDDDDDIVVQPPDSDSDDPDTRPNPVPSPNQTKPNQTNPSTSAAATAGHVPPPPLVSENSEKLSVPVPIEPHDDNRRNTWRESTYAKPARHVSFVFSRPSTGRSLRPEVTKNRRSAVDAQGQVGLRGMPLTEASALRKSVVGRASVRKTNPNVPAFPSSPGRQLTRTISRTRGGISFRRSVESGLVPPPVDMYGTNTLATSTDTFFTSEKAVLKQTTSQLELTIRSVVKGFKDNRSRSRSEGSTLQADGAARKESRVGALDALSKLYALHPEPERIRDVLKDDMLASWNEDE